MRTPLLALAIALAACSSKAPATTTGPASTGPLTEEQFKALHALPTPDPKDLKGQMIDLKGTQAYLSLPAGTGPFPAIVVIHEWWGLNGNIKHWADRLASAGWAALAVDLYSGTVATTRDEAMAAMKAVDNTKAAAVIRAGIDFIATDPRITATKKAVIGWCFGGGWSLEAALTNPDLDGAIMYYGQLELDPAKLRAIKAKFLGVFGKKDTGLPLDKVSEFEAALKQAGVSEEIYIYDADHAFANPSNPIYDQAAAADAWKHVVAFLGKL
jgi:carboxymethylenebutenolidase